MDIKLDQQSVTDGTLKVSLTETDYLPKVEQKVREYSRKANIKGFRQGKVPSGVIKKMFGKSILVEEVNHLVSHGISDYIRNNKLRVLGDPLPNEEKARAIDWDNQKDFEFEFQVGMVDDFKIDLSDKVKVTSHPIEVSDKVIDNAITDVQAQYGERSYPEVSEKTDNVYGEIILPDGTTRNSYVAVDKVGKKAEKLFVGVKKDDVVKFNIEDIADEKLKAQILDVDAAEAEKAKGSYDLKVTNIMRVIPAELNAELFEKVFGKDVVADEAAFREKVKETIASNYQRETDHLLEHEIQHYYVDNTKIEMPESFLKKWIVNTSNGQVDDETLQKEFGAYKESLKWNLITNKIADDNGVSVEPNEVKMRAKAQILEQFGGNAALAEQLGERFDQIVDNYLQGQDGKGENFMKLYNQLRAEKIMKVIREKITIAEKKVSLEEFEKLVAAHRH
ncbi:MAG TPA: trigger factor [Cyclobacteriaceae bacterium]|nr:trigger factor [Cyclobacteriaceae bacterium]